MQYGGMGHGFVNPKLGVSQSSNPTILASHQGLNHAGLGNSPLSCLEGHPNPSGISSGSGQVPTSLGMGGYGGHGITTFQSSFLSKWFYDAQKGIFQPIRN